MKSGLCPVLPSLYGKQPSNTAEELNLSDRQIDINVEHLLKTIQCCELRQAIGLNTKMQFLACCHNDVFMISCGCHNPDALQVKANILVGLAEISKHVTTC